MAKKKTFEQSMSRLEEIVAALEKGDAPLEESLALFQEGTRLISACGKALDQAQQQLKLLVQGEDGPELEDFDGEEA
ncbi:MAG: exodeoxyribonuclease VII small subunit [Clostridiaceae bacterium]|nr:exodeoxyribonuclease VII small subunit [Clostridiaceae bacterium]